LLSLFFLPLLPPPTSPLFPYTTLFRSTVTNMVATSPNAAFHNDPTCVTDNYLVSPSINITSGTAVLDFRNAFNLESGFDGGVLEDRKSTRLNSSHRTISYAVFCLKKKK